MPDFFMPIKEAAQLAVSDGALTKSRAANLELVLSAYPHLDFFPYNILRTALSRALDEGGWEPVVERDLLIFLTTLFADRYDGDPFQDLINADLPTFGDIYPLLFDRPPKPQDLVKRCLEVTGPCEKGSHNAMIERAVVDGARYNKKGLSSGFLFVANSHIKNRVVSSKIASAAYRRMIFSDHLYIVSENYYPYEVVGSIRTSAGGHVDGPQREALRAIKFFLQETGLQTLEVPTLGSAYLRFYGITPRDSNSVARLANLLPTPSRHALSRITTALLKSDDPTLPQEVLRIAAELVEQAQSPAVAALEALNYMKGRLSTTAAETKQSGTPDALARMFNEELDVTRILIYVAKADGQLRAPERKVITAACKVFTGDISITEEQVKGLLTRIESPSLTTFKESVENICNRLDEAVKRKVMRASETIVATQKTVVAAEQEALDYMSERFAKSE